MADMIRMGLSVLFMVSIFVSMPFYDKRAWAAALAGCSFFAYGLLHTVNTLYSPYPGSEPFAVFSATVGFIDFSVSLLFARSFIKLKQIKFFRQEPGVISEQPLWVCSVGAYWYMNSNIVGLGWTMLREWNDDKHLIG